MGPSTIYSILNPFTVCPNMDLVGGPNRVDASGSINGLAMLVCPSSKGVCVPRSCAKVLHLWVVCVCEGCEMFKWDVFPSMLVSNPSYAFIPWLAP